MLYNGNDYSLTTKHFHQMRTTTFGVIVIIMNPFLHMRKLSLNIVNSLSKIIELICEVAGIHGDSQSMILSP